MTASGDTKLSRLGAFAFRRRRIVLVSWIAALVVAFGLAGQLGGDYTADYSTPGSESKVAADTLAERFPGQSNSTVDVVFQTGDASSAATRERVDEFLAQAERLEGIGDAPPAAQAQISRDGEIGLVRLPLETANVDEIPDTTGERLLELADDMNAGGLRMELGGMLIADAQQTEVSSETIGIAIAALVLLITFGSIVAAGMPIGTALFGLGISGALIGVLAAAVNVPDWAPQVAAMIGIGVGIDYALLILTRYRSALAAGKEPLAATQEATATAGRSVLVAGGTVVISMMGLFLMGLNYLNGLALAASLSVLVVMAASVTLLPALLGFAGTKVNKLRLPGTGRAEKDPEHTLAARWSRSVQGHPWRAVLAGVAVIAVLATPFAGLRLGFPDAGNDGAETTTRQAYDLMGSAFGEGSAGPLLVVADVNHASARDQVDELSARLRAEPGVAAVGDAQYNRQLDTAVISVQPASAPQDEETEELLHRVRDHVVPATGLDASVGGVTAAFVDQSETTAERLPLFIAGVIALSFVLLLLAFRAPVVALKAGAMNLVSIAAAYGVVALVAQGGFAGELIGIDTETPVPPFIPVMMFAILFGLSMDYEVFLISRIREEFLGGRDTSRAVTEGLARTARVITAAAAIMIAVFGAFVLSPDVVLKLIGVGLATAILIDATIVRLVLVPAVMQLLGDRNWLVPRWVERWVPQTEPEPQPSRA